MFKFLRTYNKWILTVGGTLLMITFLAPQAIQGLAEYSAQTGATWATVGSPPEKVSAGESDLFRRQARLIDRLGPQSRLNRLGAGADPGHWYLLLREAEAAGLVGGRGSGLALAERIAASSGQNIDPTGVVLTLGQQAGLNYDQTLDTLAGIEGVERLLDVLGSAGRFSDARLRGGAARKGFGITGDVVVLDGRTDTSIELAEPDEASILAQLEEFAEDLEGQGERGFGYRVPDRFRIEWISIPKEDVRKSVESSPKLSPVELRKAFQRDPEKFGAGVTSTSVATPVFSDYEDAVRSTLLEELVDQRTKEISKFADDRIQFRHRGLDRDGLYLALPEDWAARRADLQELATEISTEFDIPVPVRSATEDWLVLDDLRDRDRFGDLGRASTELFGRTPANVRMIIENLKEFDGAETMPVQAGVALPPLKTFDDSLFIVRVTDADPSHPPADLTDIRDQVAEDLEAIRRYETLVERIPEIEATARTGGVRKVASAYGVPVQYVKNVRAADPETLLRAGSSRATPIRGFPPDSTAIATLIERALELDPTTPVADQSADRRIFAVPMPDQLSVVLVSVDEVEPVTEELWDQFATNLSGLRFAMAQDLGTIDSTELFGYEALKARHGFDPTQVPSDDDEESEEGEPSSEEDVTS